MHNSNSFFQENDALPFAEDLASLWPKGIASDWFWLGFQALEKSGLTYFENEEEQIKVRVRLTLLTIFYYEFCHQSAFHESEFFTYWDAEFILQLKKDVISSTPDDLKEIHHALIDYFGSEEKALAELWINCLEGSTNKYLRLEAKLLTYEKILTDTLDAVKYRDVRAWFLNDNIVLDDYEGIAL